MFETLIFSGESLALIPLASIPQVTSHGSVCIVGSTIYAAGGLGASAQSSADMSSYDIGSNIWTTMKNLPNPLRSGAFGGTPSKLVYTAGYYQGPNTLYSAIRQYSFSSTDWTNSTASLSAGRSDITYVNLPNGKQYCFGGTEGGTSLSSNFTLDLTQANPAPVAIAQYVKGTRRAAAVWDGSNSIYVAGGYTTDSTGDTNLFRRYNIAADSWTDLASLPVPTKSLTLMYISGRIYALVTNVGTSYFNRMYAYSVADNEWVYLGELAGEIHGLITNAVQYNNELYLVGGYNGTTRHNKVSKLIKRA